MSRKKEKAVCICATCQEEIDKSQPYRRAYDKLYKKFFYFCSAVCCADWFSEELDSDEDEEEEE